MLDGTDAALRSAYAVGERYEAGLDDRDRALGAHYTPPDVAEALVARAADYSAGGRPRFFDPSCGGGVFLVAAAEHLRRSGLHPARVIEEAVVGVDIDAGAVSAASEALTAWAAAHGAPGVVPRVVVADSLDPDIASLVGAIDIVVGNPPFRSQLAGQAVHSAARRAALAERFGGAATGYADLASLFQLVGLELVGAAGIVALIQPRSFLVARDVAKVRDHMLSAGTLREVWLPGRPVFAARVDVCVTIVERSEPTDALDDSGRTDEPVVLVTGGRDGTVVHGRVPAVDLACGATWSPVWATAHGVPVVDVDPGLPTIGSVATATAGFRDQYYGLLPHLRPSAPRRGARVVTTAMIDPGRCAWSDRPVTIARERWTAPWIDRDALGATDGRLAAWVDRLAVPKVLVATQTKVIEAAADTSGDLVPFTPVIAVVPTRDLPVAHLEAALLAPAATAWALRRFGGAGMSAGALKLAARQVHDIPLPTDRAAWDAAVAVRRAEGDWREFGRLMNQAWAVHDDALLEWWLARLLTSLH